MTTATPKLTNFRRSLVLASACAALTAATMSWAAVPGNDAPSVAVRYADLNLATSAGASALYQRIAHAARQVCPDPYTRDLTMVAAAQRCQAEAIARAVNELHNPQVALLHASRTSHG